MTAPPKFDAIYCAAIDDKRANVIIKTICKTHGFTRQELMQKGRTDAVFLARAVAIHLIKASTGFSNVRLGLIFKRDQATAWHALHHIRNRADTDPKFKAQLAEWEKWAASLA